MWLNDLGLRRQRRKQTRQDRFMFPVGTLSLSAAVGLALTLLADLLVTPRINDAKVLGGLTVLVAATTNFGAAFLRELIRQWFYKDL